jgi:hypothetical protein
MNRRFRAHQILWLIEFPSTKLHLILSARAGARVFEIGDSAVKRVQLRRYDDPPAGHHELAADAEQQLVDWITAKAANNVAVNRTESCTNVMRDSGRASQENGLTLF